MSQIVSEQPSSEHSPRTGVVHHLMHKIMSGRYIVGEPLPSTRKLSQELGVARGTISRAFTLLEEEGYLRIGDNGVRIVAHVPKQSAGIVGQSIAVLIAPPESWPKGHHEPGWGEFIHRGIIEQVTEAKLHAVTLNPELVDEETVDLLAQNCPQGMIVGEAATYSPKIIAMLKALREARLPVVVYGDSSELAELDRVTSDHEAGAYALTNLLLSRGCRNNVLLLTKPNKGLYWAEERIRGYERAMREAGLDPREVVYLPSVKGEPDRKDEFEENVRLLGGYLLEHVGSNPADGLLCVSDCFAFPIAAACRRAGRIPNRDVLIAGYDNYWHERKERLFETAVPCATADKLNYVIGQEMVKLLMERISGKLPDAPQRRVVEPKIIVTECEALESTLSQTSPG